MEEKSASQDETASIFAVISNKLAILEDVHLKGSGTDLHGSIGRNQGFFVGVERAKIGQSLTLLGIHLELHGVSLSLSVPL